MSALAQQEDYQANHVKPEVKAMTGNSEPGELKRPERIEGATYQITPATSGQAVHITINDIVLYEGTDREVRKPYEIFINPHNMENFAWMSGIEKLVNLVFRSGGDLSLMVEELIETFDPKGGYFQPGGVWMNSEVANIGHVIKEHLIFIGILPKAD